MNAVERHAVEHGTVDNPFSLDLPQAYLRWREHKLAPELAYALCSVAVDLRISEVVDAPNWLVSAYLPRTIFH